MSATESLPLSGIDVAILVGGLGTRLRGVVDDVPKPLPPLEQVVKSLRGRGKKFLPKVRSAVADLIEERSKEV